MRPFLLIIDGSIGAGKSTAAKTIHVLFPRTVFLGVDHTKWFISHFKRDQRNNTIVNTVLLIMAKEFLRQKINIIVEQDFHDDLVQRYQQLGRRSGARVTTVLLTAERQVVLSRIHTRSQIPDPMNRPKLTKSFIIRHVAEQKEKQALHTQHIDTTALSPAQVVKQILQFMKKRRRG